MDDLLRYKHIVDFAAWGIAVGSADGKTLDLVNPAFAAMLGYSAAELTGQPISMVYAPHLRDQLPKMIAQSHEACHRQYETIYQRRDGTLFPVIVDVTTVKSESGVVQYRIVHVQDISDRKVLENELKHRGEFLENIINHSAVGMAIADRAGHYVRVNRAMSEFLGYSETELLQMSYQDVTYPDDLPENEEARVFLFRGEAKTFRMEKRYVRKDGRVVWALMVVSVIPGPEGVVEYSIGQMLDIDALKRTEQSLRNSRARLATAQRIGHIGDWSLDMTTGELHYSAEGGRILGWPPEGGRVQLEDFLALIHAEDLPFVHQALASRREGEVGARNYDVRVSLGSGEEKVLHIESELETDLTGKSVRAVGTAQDVTERKRIETSLRESKRLLREMGARQQSLLEAERKRFAHEVHDELGQLLTAMKMKVSLFRMNHEDQPELVKAAGEMRDLIDRTLGVVRNVATQLRPAAVDLGLLPALEWLAQDFTSHYFIPCQVEVLELVGDPEDGVVMAAFRIAQESLTNVARHADAHKVRMVVGYDGDGLFLMVSDDGCGFRPEKKAPGETFGLMGMRERARSLGGTLKISSVINQGTSVIFNLPRRKGIRK